MLITAVGVATDPTMRHFRSTAADLDAQVRFIDLGEQAERSWRIALPPDSLSWISTADGEFRLDPDGPVYCRLIDLGSVLPTRAVEWRTVIEAWSSWLEFIPARVVNRPGWAAHNSCKPLHEDFLRGAGFSVPATLTTSSRSELVEFAGRFPCIAKPLSGQRADCRTVTVADFDDYDERSGPVHLQRRVDGVDVRVHIVGEQVIAQSIHSDDADYRLDSTARYSRISLDAEFERRLITAGNAAGLAFAGWDLRLDGDTAWVFEVNPMPGYNHYDVRADGAITRALLEYLLDEETAQCRRR